MSVLSLLKKALMITFSIPIVALGQATLRGTITDGTSKETMIGVSVIVQETSLGAATDIEGQYRIVGIPERLYKIKVSCIGYEPQVFEIDFSQTKEVVKNIELRPTVIEGEEVVVTGQMRGQTAAINQQVMSNTIVNVISEEKIKELPDVNAAEAIGRLPGVSIQRSGGEATKVVLRGLSAKFSNISIDGVTIPGTERTSKDVDLSMISQGSLAGIELKKALTPDQDADAIAGSVNLVTRKAPSEREINIELKGGYNHLMKSDNQYDISGRFAGRFFNDILGVQIQGNSERKIRSREYIEYDYDYFNNSPIVTLPLDEIPGRKYNDYNIQEFKVEFTDEVRTRNGGQVIFDINTPDSGSVKISGLYSETNRDIMTYYANYPGGGSTGNYNDFVYRNRELDISTMNTSIQGHNFLFGMDVNWGLSYAQSRAKNPYDFELGFEHLGGTGAPSTKDHPEFIIKSYLPINPIKFACSTAYYRRQENFDNDKAGFLNIIKKYTISDFAAGELKMGTKYKAKSRWSTNSQLDNNVYLTRWPANLDGSLKDYAGTRFENYKPGVTAFPPLISYFVDHPASKRDLMGIYTMYPLISKDALRLYYTLNKNGPDFETDGVTQLDDFTVKEAITSAFFMNTLNIGQRLTVITGIRVEHEQDDYDAKMMLYGGISNYGIIRRPNGTVRDTTTQHIETNFLPNVQVALRPTDFLTVRFAAYKALARPDYNLRLPHFQPGGNNIASGYGNPNLKNSKAWNYEVNTQVFGSSIGLISVSAFYKVIDDLYHEITNTPLTGHPDSLNFPFYQTLDAIGMDWAKSQITKGTLITVGQPINFQGNVTLAYNSPRPSYAWGVEFEHQLNFSFLPVSFLKPITLSYNISITRSETNIYVSDNRTDTTMKWENVTAGTGQLGWQWVPQNYLVSFLRLERRQSEGQPNLYGNAALGYDIGGFSARISVFYQDEYVDTYSPNGRRDRTVDSFTKWDIALKQDVSPVVTIYLNINNLMNERESRSFKNQIFGWVLPRSAELYGTTADLGIKLTL